MYGVSQRRRADLFRGRLYMNERNIHRSTETNETRYINNINSLIHTHSHQKEHTRTTRRRLML